MQRRSLMDELADETAGLMVGIIVIGLAMLLATLVEMVRIYREHGGPDSPIAPRLWKALRMVMGAWAVAAGLMIIPELAELGGVLASWGFGAWVLYVTYLDIQLWAQEEERAEEARDLSAFLHWQPAYVPSANGAASLHQSA